MGPGACCCGASSPEEAVQAEQELPLGPGEQLALVWNETGYSSDSNTTSTNSLKGRESARGLSPRQRSHPKAEQGGYHLHQGRGLWWLTGLSPSFSVSETKSQVKKLPLTDVAVAPVVLSIHFV